MVNNKSDVNKSVASKPAAKQSAAQPTAATVKVYFNLVVCAQIS